MVCSRTVLLSAVLLVGCVRCFNVDIENFVKHSGTPGSMFGFTVAEHKDRGTSWVLVGAPEAQTKQPGVSRGGAVYRCDVTRDDACQEVPFDLKGNNNDSRGLQLDRKSDQWFGASLSSSGVDGVIVACAPRYVWYSTRVDLREPVGTCYVAKNSFSEFSEYSPCRTRNWGYHRQGSCQAGLGATVSKNGERLYIGAVGSWYWQGQLYSMPSDVRLDYLPPRNQDFGAPGQLFSQSLLERPQFYQTREGPSADDDDSYLGYSVIAGDFDGTGQPGVAVGMPRGHKLKGKVVLFTWDLQNTQNLTGDQLGGYFGYSLCSADVDGDGLDDLVIGAPMYTAATDKNEMKYETGRVYIVFQGTEDKFRYLQSRDGTNSKGRFGLSLAGLGDINKDGFGDFAVGAPYDGPEERGAVYIYHGSKEGAMEKPSQVIYAEDIQPQLTTFGFSLAGGLDLDENQYPDVVVGAYESETAVFLRARPVIKMTASLQFGAKSKLISLKERNCTTRDGNRVACIPLKGCMEYSGEGVDSRLDFEIQFLLDSKKSRDVRMFFIDNEGRWSQNYSIKLEKGKPFCQQQTVYIKSSIRDKLTPLEAELRYSMRTASGLSAGSRVTSGRRVARSLRPILDQNAPAVQKDYVNIEKNCGKDNICIPDLKLITSPSVDQYLLGSGKRFEIDVVVENNGEDAFEAMYNLNLPPGMNYINTERIDDFEHEIPLQCSAPSPATNNTLKCDIGNPLPRRKVVHFKVLLAPFHKAGMKPRYEFYMDVNTTNLEDKSSVGDNFKSLSIPIWVETDHIVSGHPYPTDVPYNMSQYRAVNITKEAEIGPQVVHIYNIKNQGPSDIVQAEAFFVWPSHTQEDDELLYLLEQPQTTGNVRCEFVNEANALKLQLDNKNKKSFLELHGVIIDSSYNSGVTIEKSSGTYSKTTSGSSSSGSSIGGGTYVQTNTGQGSDRNTVTSHHALTDEQKRILEKENEERLVHESSESRFSNYSSWASQSGGGRVQTGGSSHQQGSRTQGGGSATIDERGSQTGNGRVQGGGVVFQAGRTQGSGSTGTGGQGRGGSGQDGVSYQGGRTSGSGSTRTDEYGGSNVNQGRGGTIQEVGWSQGSRTQGSGSTEEYGGRGGSGANQGRGAQGGGYSNQGGRGQNGGSTITEEHTIQSLGGGRVQTSQGGGNAREYGGGSNIPEEEGAYLGGRVRGSGGLTKLEQDYKTFGSQSSRDRDRQEWRNSQASRAEWRANQDGRGSTDYNSGEAGGYGRGGSESRTYVQGGGGGYDARGRDHGRDGGYGAGGERGFNQGSAQGSSSGSRTNSQGSSGDYSAGGTRLHSQGGGGSVHREYVSTGGGLDVGGQGERSYHERSNFTTTYIENGNAPRSFSNFSFANSSSGGRNVSSSWQSGDDSLSSGGLGIVGAGHSGSHETVSRSGSPNYGNVRESNLERHGGSEVRRSGYNVGNPSSAERTNWSKETRTHSTGGFDLNGGGSGVYNWTSPVDGFGLNNAGVRIEGDQSRTRHRQTASSNGQEPGISRRESKTDKQEIGDNDRDRTESRSSERSSSSSEHSSSKTHYEGGSKTRHSKDQTSGVNTLEEIDSRFQVYKRFERSVGDLINLDDKVDVERSKRSVDTEERWDQYQKDEALTGDSVARQASNFELEKALDCAVTKCSRMKCLVGPMKKDDEVFIGFRYRVWVRTLEKIGWNRASKLSTLMAARVTELPHVGEPFEMKLKTVEVPMDVFPTDAPVRPDIVPLWVVVLSACAGAIILLLLIFLLYKCGFFKRNRPSDSAEKEPLNRNGHYNSGDEAL